MQAPSNPKGILKKPPAETAEPKPQDARALAIHHATIIQNRKDLEASILDSIELLSFYPPGGAAASPPATRPLSSDAVNFKLNVRLFQPSDYGDMVEERNVNGLCGYALCPNPKPSSSGGKWTVRRGQIVDKDDYERWCCEDCKKRALYVKLQLSETAAWERAGIPDIGILLLGEDVSDADRAAQMLGEVQLDDQRRSATESAALARERGEKVGIEFKMGELKIAVKEKETRPPEGDSTVFGEEQDHLRVEGHRTGEKVKRGKSEYQSP